MKQNSKRGDDSTGEWRARTGTHHEIDTARLRALDGTPCVDEESKEAAPGADPYNQSVPVSPHSSGKFKRRSLDDMRLLSEVIKKSRK